MKFADRVEVFRQTIEPLVVEGEGSHHVFYNGDHGQKIDCEVIEKNEDLFESWLEITIEGIRYFYPEKLPRLVIGVANGTNKLAESVADRLLKEVKEGEPAPLSIQSVKREGATSILSPRSLDKIKGLNGNKDNFALVLEDVGTTGRSSYEIIEESNIWTASAIKEYRVLNLWQRMENLPILERAGISYDSLVLEPLPTFDPEACRELPEGFCRRGWDLVPYGQ